MPPSTTDIFDYSNKYIKSYRLRSNIKLSMNYIVEVFVLSAKAKPDIRMMFYKDIIIHAGSVIEAILFDKASQITVTTYKQESEFREIKVMKQLSKNKEIVWGYRVKIRKKTFTLRWNTDFILINKFLREQSILSDDLFKKVEKVRIMRNKIHLAGLDSIDKKYKVADIEEVLSILDEVVNEFSL